MNSIFVPLAKWAMLLTGNYRCVTKDAAIDIKDAVHRDLEASRSVYNWVCEVCRKLGAAPDDLVPFEKYAAAAQTTWCGRPRPRAHLFNGAPNIERTDRLVQTIAAQFGMRNPEVDRPSRPWTNGLRSTAKPPPRPVQWRSSTRGRIAAFPGWLHRSNYRRREGVGQRIVTLRSQSDRSVRNAHAPDQ